MVLLRVKLFRLLGLNDSSCKYMLDYPIKGIFMIMFLLLLSILMVVFILIFGGMLIIFDKSDNISSYQIMIVNFLLGNEYKKFMGYHID